MANASPTWLEPFERGLAHLRAREFDAGLTALDEAVTLGGARLAFFSSRTEVLTRLKVLDNSYSSAGWTGGLFQKRKGDASRLFDRLATLPDSFQAFLTIPATQLNNERPLDHHITLAARRVRPSIDPTRDFINRLPNELLTEIGRCVVGHPLSSPYTADLRSVCKRWSRVFEDAPRDQGPDLVVSYDDSLAEMVERLEEAGPPVSVTFEEMDQWDDDEFDEFYDALKGNCNQLRIFKPFLGRALPIRRIWETLDGNADKLEELFIQSHPDGDARWELGIPALLTARPVFPALIDLSLKDVHFDEVVGLLPILQTAPSLRSLYIDNCRNLHLVDPEEHRGQTLDLPHLVQLWLVGYGSRQPTRFQLVAPLLRRLILDATRGEVYRNCLFPESNLRDEDMGTTLPPNTAHLQVLQIVRPTTKLETCVLARDLRSMTKLETLALFGLMKQPRGTDILLEALTVPPTSDPRVICPRLESLRLFSLGSARADHADALVHMIRSRNERCVSGVVEAPISRITMGSGVRKTFPEDRGVANEQAIEWDAPVDRRLEAELAEVVGVKLYERRAYNQPENLWCEWISVED